jgi:Carboxypeptidase regulatory-like domain
MKQATEISLRNQRKKLAGWATLLLLILSSAYLAVAQETTGTIAGNVSDSTGAAVVGATVTTTNTQTNTVRSTVTDSAGQYTLPSLPAGTYSLSVEMNGFQGQHTDSIVLDASQTARQDFKITIGQVNQTVAVQASAAAAQLQTESGAVGEVIDGKKIVDLPLNGRNFVQLAQLIPGVNTGVEGSITVRRARGSIATTDATGGTIAIQVNGQRDTQNLFSIDGTEAMDYDAWTYSFSPSVDAIAEFRVDTSSSGTDSGAAAGANVNIIIKSGTNNLHGTLWEFNRNNDLTQTYDAIAKASVKPARLNRNQYGANFGGPLYIPHIYNGHDKTFFFFNWETGKLLNGANVQQAIVPDKNVRQGIVDASALTSSTGKPLTVIDPISGHQFQAGDHVTVDPRSAIMMSVTPAPNVTNGSSATNFNTTPVNTLNYQYDYIGRMDHSIGHKDTVSGHFIYDETYSNGPSFFGNDEDNNDAFNHLFEVSEIHVFSPSIVNEFRYGYQKFAEFETFGTTNNAKFNIANGLMQIPFSSSDPHFFGGPNLTVSGPDGAYRLFADLRNIGPRNRNNGINQFVDNLSYQRGRHYLKFGVNIGRRTDFFSQARDPHGTFNFTGQYTGSAMVDFLLGYIASDSINPTVTRTNISSLIQAYSVQDNWSVSKTLTLNLGFRWDHFAPYTQDNNKYADIYVAANGINPDIAVTPATSPYGRGLLQPTYHDFQPRIGFAWQPYGVGKTVVRGGYGIYFTPEIDNAPFSMGEGDQAQAGAQLTGTSGLTSPNPAQKIPNILFSNPFPGVTTGGPLTYPFDNEIDQHLQDQMTQEYNLTIQNQLPGAMTTQIAYVGARGTHNFISYTDVNMPLPIDPASTTLSINARRPNQTFKRQVAGDFSRGSSSYNSLQTKLERRVGRGLDALVSYTWSKSISGPADIGGVVGGGNFGATPLNPYNPRADRSISLFDIPHRFVGTLLYDVPFFQSSTGLKKILLAGFQVSTIVTAVSGDASNVSYSGTSNTGTGIASRPDVVPGQTPNFARGKRTPMEQFNVAAFTAPQPGEFGTSPRTDAVRLPGTLNDDFSATKGFKFGDARNLQFRADFFNAFQHYNPDPSTITTNITSKTYGRINNGLSGGFATRVIQLAAKFYF